MARPQIEWEKVALRGEFDFNYNKWKFRGFLWGVLGFAPIILTLSLLIFSWSRNAKYAAVITQGRATNKYLQQFDKLYPDAIHYVSYFNFPGGDRIWNAESFLYGRYTLTCQMDITLSAANNQVQSWGKAHFYLVETRSIKKLPSGQWHLIPGEQFQFGEDKWDTLAKSGGDFSSIGIDLVKDSPLPGFEAFAYEYRRSHPLNY